MDRTDDQAREPAPGTPAIHRDSRRRPNPVGSILEARHLGRLDAAHPPAIATSRNFASRLGQERTWGLFVMALAEIASLVVLGRAMLWLLARLDPD
jgi:hypothetical protein